ncbi:unnamed protein product [Sphagnum jensenii]|uniref:Peptidase S59 domain-containing protein n=1 Tax=Sphagnum jensenii TaxID=128206 RepID=A0ABP1AUN1_9BRYO
MFGSSSPFGASSSSSPFGASPAASNPFGTTTSPFGMNQSSNLFGAKPFGSTTPFGGQTGSSLFGSGTATGVFGATQPTTFGASSGAFGASSSAPAFGSGAPIFGQKPASPFGGFGTSQPQANIFGSPALGQTQASFGSQPFGSTTPAFGAQSAPAFGSTPAPAFGATSTPAFGASAPSFGSTPAFGQTAPAFGASAPSPVFGSSGLATPFGSQTGSAFGTSATTTFGSGFGLSAFGGQQRVGSRAAPYAVTPDPDTGTGGQVGKFMSISAMPAYKNKSHEELRWEDYQAGDKGGPNPATPQQPAGGIFGQNPQAASPFGGTSTASFGQTTTPNPFASSTSSLFTPKPTFGSPSTPTPAFGATTPAFGSSTFGTTTPSPFATTSAFGQSSTAPAFGLGSTSSPFGQPSTPAFGSTAFGSSTPAFGTSTFGTTQPAFGSSLAFGSSTPASGFNTVSSSPFGGSSLFGNTPASPTGGLFQSPASQPFGAASTPAFGSTTPSFGTNLFNTGTSGSIFGQTKSAGLAQSTNMMSATPVPVTNPFGTLPAMPQMLIGRSAGSGPSVQYGISSMPVSEKPTQVRTTSLLTPRHITQQSKVRMHARRYHPKKDSPKVSFFSDGDEVPTTPKADVMFVPRENPRALFIRQPEQSPITSTTSRGTPDARDIATPVQGNDQSREPIPQTNGSLMVQSHRANGFFSATGVNSSEVVKNSHAHGSDIEVLMPKLHHSDYFTEPRIQELAAKERAEPGYCRRVVDFVVGRLGYGAVKFLGETDVRGLDLESIIQFNKCEVLVYMDESKKPPVGQGLNKPAQVTLLNVKCVDKKTGQHYSDGPEVEKFEKRLKNKTEKQGAEFISYSALKGEWKFQVQHFSRFGLDVDSDEEDSIPRSDQQKAFHSSGLLTNTGDDIEEESEEVLIEELQTIAPQPALPHSLPAHLGLDPLKMQQMRALFFADGEEAADIALPGKFGQKWARQSAAAISDPASNVKHLYQTPVRDLSIEEGEDQLGWPQHLPHRAAGPSANQMRVSPHTSWRRSPAYTALEDKMSGQQSPSRSPVLALAMHAHEDGSTPKRPRGSGFWLEASNKSQSLATGRSDHIADAALFLGCSFRVGWGPNGVLVHSAGRVGQKGAECVLSSCIQFERVAFDQTVRDEQGTVRDELVQLQFIAPLTLHMSMSQVLDGFSQLATGHLRLRNLVCSPMELPRVCHEYEILTEKQHEVDGLRNGDHVIIRHQAMVWRLTSVLFAEKPSLLLEDQGDEQEVISDDRVDPEAEPLIRKAKFSSWLQDSVSDLVKGELQQLKNGNEQQVKEIFTHLTGRQLDEAVEKAILRRDVRLSCLLAIAGGAVENRLDMASQLELWASEGLDQSLIEPDMMSIFRLLAGDLWGSLDGRGIDWKRFLGLVMWYQQPPDTDLPNIISSYEQFVRESRAPIPIPKYVEDRHIDDEARDYTNTYDSAYYLMLLHAKKEQPDAFDARKMLCPAAATYNWLDHQLAWHQESILRAIKALDTQELLHSLHMNFASQLLALGLCHWALYVVLHMPWSPSQPNLHEKVVKEILNQYCETWSSSEAQQQFLEYDLRIPSEWLHEALAVYWRYAHDTKKEMEHLIKSSQWRSAHVLFMTSVAATLFVNLEHSQVWQVASQLEGHDTEVENWDIGAGLYIEFYTLKTSFVDSFGPINELDSLEKKTAACKAFFEQLRRSQNFWKNKTSADARVAYAKMADEISVLLIAETKTAPLAINAEMEMYDTVLDAPLPEDARMCHLQGAVSTFTSWLLEEVTI